MIKIYNSLTKKKEEFIPIIPRKVGIYGCGITPYKPSHLGHAMQGIIFDVIRRYFEYKGYDVKYVRNYTDIEDRIIARAKDARMNALEYSRMIIDQCDLDFERLRVRRADFTPKVSEFIPQIIEAILVLIQQGHAYVTNDGNVYYTIKSFPEYGKLSNQKLEKIRIGVRKENEKDKRDVSDFALWKNAKTDEFSWDSPWGKGRPGWHIECSVMSSKHLGKHFDIHGGGADLIFPHHENEIAQSEPINNGHFVNYWIHNGLLMVGDKKMSKSLNNDISIADWLKRYHPEIIRYLILTNHYRSHVQFVPERYVEATKKVYQAYKTLNKLDFFLENNKKKREETLYSNLINEFEKNMENDFNTAPVVAQLNFVITKINEGMGADSEISKLKAYSDFIKLAGGILGIFDLSAKIVIQEIEDLYLSSHQIDRASIEKQVNLRTVYRAQKDFKHADAIRQKLLNQGITLLDSNQSTTWELAQ